MLGSGRHGGGCDGGRSDGALGGSSWLLYIVDLLLSLLHTVYWAPRDSLTGLLLHQTPTFPVEKRNERENEVGGIGGAVLPGSLVSEVSAGDEKLSVKMSTAILRYDVAVFREWKPRMFYVSFEWIGEAERKEVYTFLRRLL